MTFGAGLPSARCLTPHSWKNASSLPETNHRRSMPFSFIDATSASADCSAGMRYSRLCPVTVSWSRTCVAMVILSESGLVRLQVVIRERVLSEDLRLHALIQVVALQEL